MLTCAQAGYVRISQMRSKADGAAPAGSPSSRSCKVGAELLTSAVPLARAMAGSSKL